MALPAKVKTWQLTSNLNPEFPGTDANCVGALFILVKDAMKAFALNAWTCEGSSDSVTAGMDAVDRLITFANVVRPGGVHSWIVLEQAAMGPTQVCFDWNSGDPEEVYVWMSPSAGFTGGSTSARPTATDEVGIVVSGQDRVCFVPVSHISGNAGTSVRAHVMQSSDGKCTRIITCQGNVARTFFSFETPINPATGWTDPYVFVTLGSTGLPTPPQDPMSIYYLMNNYDYINSQGPISVMKMNATLQGFATGGTSDGTVVGYTPWPNANELSGGTDYPLTGIGMLHGAHGGAAVVGQRGRHGWFADMYVTALSVAQGKSFPGDGSKSWVVFGNMVLPWDGGDVEIG